MRRLFAFAVALTAMTGLAIGAPPSDNPNNNANAAKQDAKDTAKASKDAAKDTAKDSKDAAKDSAKASKEAAKDNASAAKDSTKSEKDAAKDSAKSASDSAKDTAKSAKDTAKDTSKSANDTAKSASKSASDTAKTAEKNANDTVKTADEVGDKAANTARDTADSARDTADDARDSARDTARDARESARDTARDARDTARDARSSARDAGRSAREGARDTARDARDSSRDVRDSARSTRDSARDTARDARDRTRDDVRDARDTRDARSTDRRDRRDTRETARSSRNDNRRSVEQLGLAFGRVTDRGLTISNIERDSVFYRAGLRDDDVIISVAGHDITAVRDFDRYLYSVDRNDRIEVVVWRDGREEVIYLEPDVIFVDDVDTVQTSYAYDLDHFGVVLDDSYDDRIVIVKVLPNTPAYAAGLRAGDVITTWHGEPVSSRRDFVRVIERAEPGTVNFEYQRNDRTVRADANLRRETFRNERQADRAERRISRDANRATDVRTGEEVRQPVRGQTVPEARRDRAQDRREGTRPVVPGGGLLPRNR